jgi:hypothetical protein
MRTQMLEKIFPSFDDIRVIRKFQFNEIECSDVISVDWRSARSHESLENTHAPLLPLSQAVDCARREYRSDRPKQ